MRHDWCLDGRPTNICIQKCVGSPEYTLEVKYPFRGEAWNEGLPTNDTNNVKD